MGPGILTGQRCYEFHKRISRRCISSGVCHLPGLESIHFISAGARRRERPRPVPFVLIGRSWYNGRRLSSLSLPPAAAAPSHRQLRDATVGRRAVHSLVGLAVGYVTVATVSVVGRGVDAAIVGPALVKEVGVRIGRLTEATHASSLSRCASVEPALVAVAARGVTGQGVAAGVAGVLSLTLRRTQNQRSSAKRRKVQRRETQC